MQNSQTLAEIIAAEVCASLGDTTPAEPDHDDTYCVSYNDLFGTIQSIVEEHLPHRVRVNADEVRRVKQYLRGVNKHRVEDIEWVDDKGQVIQINPKDIQEWSFIGLNSSDFVECYLDAEKT